MSLRFKVDVLELLKEKGYNSKKLRENGLVGESSMTKIRKGEMVGITTLDNICSVLETQPAELIEWYKE